MEPRNPKHGDVIERCEVTFENGHDFYFEAVNGEGLCLIPKVERRRSERRWCDRCRAWVTVEGELQFLQANYVGCLRCSKPWR